MCMFGPDDVEKRRGPERTASPSRDEQSLTLELLGSAAPLPTAGDIAKARWKAAVRRILDEREGSIPHVLSSRSLIPVAHLRNIVPVALIDDLQHKLKQMATEKPILIYDSPEGLVKFLNFSSDGNTLATSRYPIYPFLRSSATLTLATSAGMEGPSLFQ